MLEISNDFNKATKADNRRFETRIKINDKLYTKQDINSWSYTGGSISGETFQIGSTFSNSVKIEFCSILDGVKELDEVTVEVGIAIYDADYNYDNIPPEKVGSARVGYAKLIHYKPTIYEYVSMGTFYVTKSDPDRNAGKTVIEARDKFLFLENLYVSELSYPTKIRDVALEIANKSGAIINENNFSMISSSLIDKPVGYTFRQAIGLVAQFEAGYARFNRLNQLEVMRLVDPKFSVSPAEYFQRGLVKNELMYQVGGISCTVSIQKDSGTEQVTYSSGSNTGPQITLENKVMTQALLDVIYNKIKNLNFYPFSLKWRGNPALETGDWITLADRDGKQFKTPNLSYTLNFKGGLTASSSASTNSSAQTVSAYFAPLSQTLKEFSSRIDAAGNNSVYDGLTPPPYPKAGDLWFKKNGPDDEIWIYSKLEEGTYGWVLQTSTRLSDEIQEKIDNSVPSDEIVKTINLSKELDGKEWLQISGAKIWLTDQTRIDDAIIKDAMIGNLSASKINAGTLNAADVNVINLNAKSLTAGKITGKNLSIDLDSGEVLFQKGVIKRQDGNFSVDITNGILESYTSAGGYTLKDGEISFRDKSALNPSSNEKFGRIGYNWMPAGLFSGFQDAISVQGNQAWAIGTKNSETVMLSRTIGSFIGGSNDDAMFSAHGKIKISAGVVGSIGTPYILIGANSSNGQVGSEITISGTKVSILGSNTYLGINASVVGELTADKLTANQLNIRGSKNAIHVTRDGVRATPAYETAEAYLGDIGSNYTRENCEVWIDIDELFSDTVNTDIAYQVFLQAYCNSRIWVEDFRSDRFLIKSDKPMSRFAWEIKAKRRGYENDRLVTQEDFDNEKIEEEWHGEKNE